MRSTVNRKITLVANSSYYRRGIPGLSLSDPLCVIKTTAIIELGINVFENYIKSVREKEILFKRI